MAKKHRKESLDALFREKVLLEMLKIAGVGMWTYSTETGRLRYIGFADTIHRHDELQYVDPADYLKLMNGEDLQTVTQFMADIHAGRPPQEGIRYKIHGNGEDFYLENHVVTCQPLGNGFYYLKGYVKNITAQVMEANRLCIEKERTEQADRLRSAFCPRQQGAAGTSQPNRGTCVSDGTCRKCRGAGRVFPPDTGEQADGDENSRCPACGVATSGQHIRALPLTHAALSDIP